MSSIDRSLTIKDRDGLTGIILDDLGVTLSNKSKRITWPSGGFLEMPPNNVSDTRKYLSQIGVNGYPYTTWETVSGGGAGTLQIGETIVASIPTGGPVLYTGITTDDVNGTLFHDPTNFFYDDVNKILYIGPTAPEQASSKLVVAGQIEAQGAFYMSGNVANPLRMKKVTVAASNPGSGFGTLRWEAGTTAGTLKLVAYAGTSTTGVTIVDNVGTGS